MQFKELIADDRAVSPVIGVILMVAITVILAAVIGTFVLGLGSSVQKTTPQAQFGFEVNGAADAGTANCLDSGTSTDKEVEITHESGEGIDADTLSVSSSQGTEELVSDCNIFNSNTKITAGSSWTVDSSPDSTIRVIWNSQEGDNSATLANFDVPS